MQKNLNRSGIKLRWFLSEKIIKCLAAEDEFRYLGDYGGKGRVERFVGQNAFVLIFNEGKKCSKDFFLTRCAT